MRMWEWHITGFIFFIFEYQGWCPPVLGALRLQRTLHISVISHRPDRKGTLASNLKGAGAQARAPSGN